MGEGPVRRGFPREYTAEPAWGDVCAPHPANPNPRIYTRLDLGRSRIQRITQPPVARLSAPLFPQPLAGSGQGTAGDRQLGSVLG